MCRGQASEKLVLLLHFSPSLKMGTCFLNPTATLLWVLGWEAGPAKAGSNGSDRCFSHSRFLPSRDPGWELELLIHICHGTGRPVCGSPSLVTRPLDTGSEGPSLWRAFWPGRRLGGCVRGGVRESSSSSHGICTKAHKAWGAFHFNPCSCPG